MNVSGVNVARSAAVAAAVLLLLAGCAHTAADLGRAEGYPVCDVRDIGRDERCLVGTLSHFDAKLPSHVVAKADAPRALKRAAAEPALDYAFRGAPGRTIDAFLADGRNTGLLVMRGDTILAERYKYDRTPEMRFQSYSMAKTVVAMLLGIALHEGRIQSLEQKAEEFVPQLKGHPYGETSLRHLLTMSSGVRFSEEYSGRDDVAILAQRTLFGRGPGGADSVKPFTVREVPAGTRFKYASAETEVLGLVVRAAVGKPLAEYLSEKIWKPMGAEADATWMVDAGGNELGYMGLNATLRDWGRLGLLLANYGARDGRQIIPAAWVKAATTPESPHLQVGVATKFNGYGYQTWVIRKDQPYFALLGVRGQAVMVDPVTQVVVVHTAVHNVAAGDPLRGEQFALFFGVVNYVKKNAT